MLLSSILLIIFAINTSARHIHTSFAGLNELLDRHPRSPIFAIVRNGVNHNTNSLRTKDENVAQSKLSMAMLWDTINHIAELQKGKPKLELSHRAQRIGEYEQTIRNKMNNKEVEHPKIRDAKRAIGYWLKRLQVKDLAILEKLRQKLAITKAKYKNPLRAQCNAGDSYEHRSLRTKEYRQKSNREVYAYFKSHHGFRSESKHRSKTRAKSDNISTRGPDSGKDQCGGSEEGGSTKIGPSDKCTTKRPKKQPSTKIHTEPKKNKDNCISNEGSTKGPKWDECEENKCSPKSGSTKGPKWYRYY